MFIERRQLRRERMHERAQIVFNGGQSAFCCTVRNRCEGGAMVRLSDWTAVPSTFDLATDRDSIRVRQSWRRGDDIGVAFLSTEDLALPAPVSLAAARAARNSR